MATVNEKLAKKVAANEGVYPGDPQCYSVFRYRNPHFGSDCFAIAYTESDDSRYAEFEREFLWHKDGRHKNGK